MLGLRKTSSLNIISIVAFIVWTLLICILSYTDIAAEKKKTIELAKKEVLTTFNVNIAIRHWAAKHGGVYVPVTEFTPPSPYLSHLPYRDITTPAGVNLTLLNAPYVLRQVMEEYAINSPTKAHLTSLKALNSANDPDEWERSALKKLQAGESEIFEEIRNTNAPVLRFMRPEITTRECLSCHGAQGYKVGDIRGANSISLPMAPYLLSEKEAIKGDMTTHFAFWLAGSLALLFITFWGRSRIVENNRFAETLRKKDFDFQSIFKNSPVPMVIVDKKNDKLSCNAKLTMAFGYTLDDISTEEKWWNSAFPELKYREKVKAGWEEAIAEHETSGKEIATQIWDLTCKDGSRRTAEFNFMFLAEVSVFTLTDITERKKAEEALVEEKNKLEAVVASLGDGLTVQDRNLKVIYQNAIHIERQGDCEGEYCYKAYQGRDSICDGCSVVKCFDDGQVHKRETTLTTREGKKLFAEISASPVLDSKGRIIGAVETVRDVTQGKLLEKQLRQAQKMEAMGTLAGGIAHDFNNLLTIILGYTKLIEEEVGPANTVSPFLDAVVQAGTRAVGMVEQILTFSRQTEHKRGPLQIHLIVKETLKLLSATLPSTIEVKQDIDPDCGFVESDAGQINQLVMNLCTNAYHAMRETGGILTVTLRPIQVDPDDKTLCGVLGFTPGSYVELLVKDNGHGIDKENIERIFEPYFSTKAQGEGTGLGLAVVHGAVVSHAGHIFVTSEPGEGAEFHVYLPQMTEKSLAGLEEKPEEGFEGSLQGTERLLVVDDEEMLANLEKRLLEGFGYKVEAFSDSTEALQAFKKRAADFDLIVTDMTMPGLTGTELCAEVNKIRSDIPVILCTGFSELIGPEEAVKLGVQKFLTKPVERDVLAKAIREILDEVKGI